MSEPAKVVPIRETCTCSPECQRPIQNYTRKLSNACAKRAIREEQNLKLAKLEETVAWQKKRIDEQIEIIALLREEIRHKGFIERMAHEQNAFLLDLRERLGGIV